VAKGGIGNTKKIYVNLGSFIGGQATDYKNGIANSFYSSQGLDFRQKLSQMSVLPGFRAASTNLNDLITCMVQDKSGVRYGVGNQGYCYRISTSGVISTFGKLSSNGAAGIVYNQQSDQLYMSGQQTVSLYGQVSGSSPQFRGDNFGVSASVANAVIYIYNTSSLGYDGNTDNNTGLTTQRNNMNTLTATGVTPTNYSGLVTNTLANTTIIASTAISETAGSYCPFVPDIEPMYGVAVYVTAVGSGSLTLTMHDSLNNNLGAVTITNGDLKVGWNMFQFTSPGIRTIINPVFNGTGQGNHFHLTSSVTNDTTTVATIAANNLAGVNMVYFAYRLVKTNNGWHPMTNFGPYLCIGNGPYISTYEYTNDANPSNTQWVRHQLVLDFGYEVTSLSTNNQYLVIAAEKRSSDSANNYQDGYLYFWDGINITYNFKIEISMGAPYSVFTLNNVTYFYCAGSLFAWGGGQQVIKVRYMAYQNTDYLGTYDNTIVNPNMMDVRYNLLMLGYPSSTTNVNVNYGVYSWGSVELAYPNSFGYSYASSTGILNYSASNNFQLGMIKNFVDTLYQSWQYTDVNSVTHYGLDITDNTSSPTATFSWQSLIWDGGVRYKLKQAMRLRINFLPLPANTTLTANYTIDRGTMVSADPSTGTSYSASTGDTAITVEINNGRFKELQWGFSGTCASGATAPVITGVTMEIMPHIEEVELRNNPKG
jgi:hypothetical protein